MKTLDRKIEEDITQVEQNNSYPTQIVINLDDLKPVDETHWQVGDTDIILTGQKHFLITTIDGIQYCTLTKYDVESIKTTGYIRQIKPDTYVNYAEELVQHIKDKTKSK